MTSWHPSSLIKQDAACMMHHTWCGMPPASCLLPPALLCVSFFMPRASCNRPHATCNTQQATSNWQSTPCMSHSKCIAHLWLMTMGTCVDIRADSRAPNLKVNQGTWTTDYWEHVHNSTYIYIYIYICITLHRMYTCIMYTHMYICIYIYMYMSLYSSTYK